MAEPVSLRASSVSGVWSASRENWSIVSSEENFFDGK